MQQQHALLSRIGDYGDEALDTIIQVMRKTRAGPGDATRLRAAMDVLDRIIGRPTQSLAASIIQRTVAADGTLIEGSAMMSPLLQAAQAHFVEEEMRQLAAPKTEPEPEPSPPPSLPESIALPEYIREAAVRIASWFPRGPSSSGCVAASLSCRSS